MGLRAASPRKLGRLLIGFYLLAVATAPVYPTHLMPHLLAT